MCLYLSFSLGSTTIGNNVHIGGQVGIAQHLKIGDNVRVAAKSGVMHDLAANATYGSTMNGACAASMYPCFLGGVPAVPIMEMRRQMSFMRLMGHKSNANVKI
jgi:UDP-3-O-[3-hydroxymyristoyl] glucosamine N-acyltransferase